MTKGGKGTGTTRAASTEGKVGFWHMTRDVFVASLNKGQFPVALAGFIFWTMILRMPKEDVSRLTFEIFKDLKAGYLVGYVLAVLLAFAWFFHSKRLRRITAQELQRVTAERNRLQS